MEMRRVIIAMEVETDKSIKELKDKSKWAIGQNFIITQIKQIQVNVIQKKGGGKK